MKLKKITNKHIQDYLEENGIYPVKEYGNEYWYRSTLQLVSLLDSYFIQYICIPNKL